MAHKKETDTRLSPEEQTQLQHLLEHYHQIAQDLHATTTVEQAQGALASVNDEPEAVQTALLKALAKERDTDAADVLRAINELGADKSARKEARRALIRLEEEKVYPRWQPPRAAMPIVQVHTAQKLRFWRGLVTRSREEGEVQLTLCWEHGRDYHEVRLLTFLLDFWEQGLKELVLEDVNKRQVEARFEHMRAQLPDISIVDCTLAEGRRLIEEALSVNAWRGTRPVDTYLSHRLTVKQLVFDEKDAGEDRGLTFIDPGLEPDELTATFIAAWSLGDFGMAYDLLADDSPMRGGRTRDAWITQRRAWADEAQPTRFDLGYVRETEVKASGLWMPPSYGSFQAVAKRQIEICWSLEMSETPLSGTLEEMALGTAVNKETGRRWFWTSYTLGQEQGAWRIQKMSDEGAKAQALSIAELQKRVKEHDQRINEILQVQNAPAEEALELHEELIWRLIQTMHYDDALLVHLPLDRLIYGDAYSRARGLDMYERAMVYLERMADKFADGRAAVLCELSIIEQTLADHYTQRGMQEQAQRFYKLAEATIHRSLAVENSVLAHGILAALLTRLGVQLDEAEEHLLQARGMAPNPKEEIGIEDDLGKLALKRQRFAEALAHFKRVIELNAHFPDVWTNIGAVYRNLQQFEDAKLAYERAIEEQPLDFRPYTELASVYLLQGQEQAARAVLEGGVQLMPDSALLLAFLSTVYLSLGERRKAQEALEKAERIDPQLDVVKLARDELERVHTK